MGTALGALAVAQQAFSTPGTVMPGALPLDLKVRRVRDGVEVVIENAGSAPQLEQTSQGTSWLGRLTTSRPAVLLRGPQAVALPEAGAPGAVANPNLVPPLRARATAPPVGDMAVGTMVLRLQLLWPLSPLR